MVSFAEVRCLVPTRRAATLSLHYAALALVVSSLPASSVADDAGLSPQALRGQITPERVQAMARRAAEGDQEAQRWVCLLWCAEIPGMTEAAGLSWCRQAAERGSAKALACVGEALIEGRATAADPEAGLRLLRQAAEQGEVLAQLSLAERLSHGRGTAADRPEGCRWARRAAETTDNPQADYLWAGCLGIGDGVEPDYEESDRWLRRAAVQGYPPAVALLEKMQAVREGSQSPPEPPPDMLRLMVRAAEAGDATAQRELAESYAVGDLGVPKDMDIALQWYRRAADNGDPESQFFLGSQLYAGSDVDQDFAEAWAYLSRAAEQGHSLAPAVLEELEPFMNEVLRTRGQAKLEALRAAAR